jgi:ribosomal protein S20
MPNNRNAAKAMRQSEKRRLRNRIARTSLRTVVKKVRDAVAALPFIAGVRFRF